MGGPSSDSIRCANQNSERKDPSRGICLEGNSQRKEPLNSKCDSGTCWAYFMAYGVIESISMSAFVAGVLALELPLSKCYVFPNPFIWLFIVLLSHLQVPFYKVSSYNITAWDWGECGKGRAQVWIGF
jgi:hypothetical protein